jgi:RNA polymerase sigma-70 factor (ECF subfamily)
MDAERLFREHYDSLTRYLFRFTGDVDAAADAAQEAFTRLLERGPGARNARAWLFAVATNVARDAARTRSRRRLLLLAGSLRAPVGDLSPLPDAAAAARQERERVRSALLELAPKERSALLMREEGFSQREIAQAVGTTTGSVGTLIARALTKLARILNLDEEELR